MPECFNFTFNPKDDEGQQPQKIAGVNMSTEELKIARHQSTGQRPTDRKLEKMVVNKQKTER